MTQETLEKIYKSLIIILKALIAVAAIWLAISCTMSMSISKNNSNSSQSTEQSTSIDSIHIVPSGTLKKF